MAKKKTKNSKTSQEETFEQAPLDMKQHDSCSTVLRSFSSTSQTQELSPSATVFPFEMIRNNTYNTAWRAREKQSSPEQSVEVLPCLYILGYSNNLMTGFS